MPNLSPDLSTGEQPIGQPRDTQRVLAAISEAGRRYGQPARDKSNLGINFGIRCGMLSGA
jgi:hypothetical protein